MKKFVLTLLSVMLIFALSVNINAQDTKLIKNVFTNGGFLMDVNTDNIKISGALGQIAIEKLKVLDGNSDYSVYQGFWVPFTGSGTPVDEDRKSVV